MTEYFNDNGDFEYTADSRVEVQIRTTCEFNVAVNDILIGPNSSNDRFLRIKLNIDENLSVFCPERYSIAIKQIAQRGETPDPNSMVEIIPEGELSMYDKLRQEMLGKLSQIASQTGHDSYEEDDDMGWDDPETEVPLTPYEYKEMHEEYLIEEAQNAPEEKQPEAPTPSEQPASTQADIVTSDTL